MHLDTFRQHLAWVVPFVPEDSQHVTVQRYECFSKALVRHQHFVVQ